MCQDTGTAIVNAKKGRLVWTDGDDEGAIAWLFTPDDSLGCSPMTALLAGRKSEVRRVAQSEL